MVGVPASQPAPDRTDMAALAIACAMAFLAGATDIYGLARLHDLFVSFMSGNTTMLAFALGHGDLARAGMIAGLIALFVAGATIGTSIAVLSGRYHAATVAFAVTIMLALPLLWSGATIAALTLAMGMLNAAMQRAGATGVSLTYVTGTLVKFAQGMGHRICGRRDDTAWKLQGLLWLALLGGAASATLMQVWPGEDTLWPLPLLAMLLAAVTAFRPEPARL
jgi:uncharacterized membrane protein YoaK (UPF0700 family)